MGTKLNKVPTTEKELNELLQNVYLMAKKNYEERKQSNFTGILEIIASEPNIVSAIHKIKGNKGSNTAGVDKKVMSDYLEKGYDEVLEEVKSRLYNYNPEMVRRVWIPNLVNPKKDHLEYQRSVSYTHLTLPTICSV